MENSISSVVVLFRKSIDYYKKVGFLILKSIQYYWVIIATLLILFGLAFFYKYSVTKTHYTVKVGYIYNTLNKKYYGDIIYDLELLIRAEKYDKIANQFNIEREISQNILNLKAKNIVGSSLEEDYSDIQLPFYVHLDLRSEKDVLLIVNSLTNYLQTDEFSKTHIKNEHNKIEENLRVVNSELAVIDSLIAPNTINVVELLNLKSTKIANRNNLKDQLSIEKNIEILKVYSSFEVSKTSKIKSFTLKLGVLFILMSIILPTFLYWYNNEK